MTYYLKSLLLILRHPIRTAPHLGKVARREFRLHWLRDIAAGRY